MVSHNIQFYLDMDRLNVYTITNLTACCNGQGIDHPNFFPVSMSTSSVVFHNCDAHDSCSTRSQMATKKQVIVVGRNPSHEKNVDVFVFVAPEVRRGSKSPPCLLSAPTNPFESLGTVIRWWHHED